MTKSDWVLTAILLTVMAFVTLGWLPDTGAGGINTAGGMCPDGIQEGEDWSSTSNWTRLPQSEGMLGEQVSEKWDRVEMTVYMCNDGTMMGRAHPRRGTKGR